MLKEKQTSFHSKPKGRKESVKCDGHTGSQFFYCLQNNFLYVLKSRPSFPQGRLLKKKSLRSVLLGWEGEKLASVLWNLCYNKAHLTDLQFSSVAQSCPTLCNPMDCSTPGLPVHQQFPEFTHTHVYRVGDAIQPSHPLSSPSPPAFNLSQHWGLFQ